MTTDTPKPDTTEKSPRRETAEDKRPPAEDGRQESEEEKIRREQAANPALMPIGDPAGAA